MLGLPDQLWPLLEVQKKVVVGIRWLTPGYVTPVHQRALPRWTLAAGERDRGRDLRLALPQKRPRREVRGTPVELHKMWPLALQCLGGRRPLVGLPLDGWPLGLRRPLGGRSTPVSVTAR